jgi:hypothetical protein
VEIQLDGLGLVHKALVLLVLLLQYHEQPPNHALQESATLRRLHASPLSPLPLCHATGHNHNQGRSEDKNHGFKLLVSFGVNLLEYVMQDPRSVAFL